MPSAFALLEGGEGAGAAVAPGAAGSRAPPPEGLEDDAAGAATLEAMIESAVRPVTAPIPGSARSMLFSRRWQSAYENG